MNLHFLIFLIFFACLVSSDEQAEWKLHYKSGKQFRVVSGTYVNWFEAKLLCETQFTEPFNDNRTSLATIKSWDEQKFVYSLALRSSAQQTHPNIPNIYWIGSRRIGNKTTWIDEKRYRDVALAEDASDEVKYKEIFEANCFDECPSNDDDLCGRLDLTRFVHSSGNVSKQKPWYFFDCHYFTGFICQHRKK